MTVWWLTLLSTYILGLIARQTARPVYTNGKLKYKNNVVYASLACLILILVAGLRSGIGDTPAYVAGFEEYPDTLEGIWEFIKHGESKDKGFYTFAMLIKTFISENSQVYIFLLSMITLTLIFISFYKSTDMIDLAIFLFITTGCYLVTMNGIRQYLVSAILFCAFPWIKQKKWYLYLPLVVLVSTMHGSALIFIPLYFIIDDPAWGRVTKLLMITGMILFITYPVSGPMLANILQESQYSDYENLLTSTGAGANFVRVAVMAVPLIMAYLGRDMMEGKEKYYNIIINMSIINFFAILLATRYWIYARFNMYFSLYMILLIIWCVKYLFDERNTKIIYIMCLSLYGLYYWYEMAISLGQNYTSHYLTFWN